MWKWWRRWKKSEFYGHPVATRYTVASKLSRRLCRADPAERRFDAGTGSRYLINMEKKDEISRSYNKYIIGIPRLLLSGLNQVQDDQYSCFYFFHSPSSIPKNFKFLSFFFTLYTLRPQTSELRTFPNFSVDFPIFFHYTPPCLLKDCF